MKNKSVKLVFLVLISLFFTSKIALALPPDLSLVGYWPFDEGTGSIAYDKSLLNNNGTVYGATWTQGRYGQALSFDGLDDYAQVPNSDSLNMQD
ncbi:MAG: hypothetical protein HY776_06180 [Actinobacteria bacterium]|nr:hypothetical protein [Actinomycetota bacterium]